MGWVGVCVSNVSTGRLSVALFFSARRYAHEKTMRGFRDGGERRLEPYTVSDQATRAQTQEDSSASLAQKPSRAKAVERGCFVHTTDWPANQQGVIGGVCVFARV